MVSSSGEIVPSFKSSKLAGKMEKLAMERYERYEPDVRAVWFPITMLHTMTFIGTYSWSTPALKRRFIDQAIVVNELFEIPQTPPEIARDYLRSKYTEYRRHTLAQYARINEPRSAPRYSRRGNYPAMSYVDIRAAYWTIIQIVGWDVDYHPGRWIGKRSENDDFPIPKNKLARNCLVTAGLMTPSSIWTGEKLKPFKTHNTLVNYDLWALVNDVLHSVATLAISRGAVYVNTDGYIVPSRQAPALMDEIREWGLEPHIKASGDATIWGVGAYRVGEVETKHRPHFAAQDISAVYEPDISWLKARIGKFSRSHINWID